MNIMTVDVVTNPDAPPGPAKGRSQGTDLFAIIMDSLAAGNLLQQIRSDPTAVKGEEPSADSPAAANQQVPAQMAVVDSDILEGQAQESGLKTASEVPKDVNVISLLDPGKAIDPDKAEKNGSDRTLNFISFQDKSLKGAETGSTQVAGLKGLKAELIQQDAKEIATARHDGRSDTAPLFTHLPIDQVVAGGLNINEKGSKVQATLPVEPADIVEQVSGGFKSVIKGGSGEIRMELHPDSLGHLKIEVKVDGGVVKANIMTENAVVKDTIDSNLATLRTTLEEHGLRIDQLTVGIDQRQNGNAFAERERFQMWQSFNGGGVKFHDEDQSLNEPFYRADYFRSEGVSIFA